MGTEFQGYANTCDIQYNNTHFTQVCDSSAEEVGTIAHKRCSISSIETVVGTFANKRKNILFLAAVVQIRGSVYLFSAAVHGGQLRCAQHSFHSSSGGHFSNKMISMPWLAAVVGTLSNNRSSIIFSLPQR